MEMFLADLGDWLFLITALPHLYNKHHWIKSSTFMCIPFVCVVVVLFTKSPKVLISPVETIFQTDKEIGYEHNSKILKELMLESEQVWESYILI